MISRLLSLISTAKGAAAATVIAAAGVGTGVVTTNTDVQNAIGSVVQNLAPASPSAKAEGSGQPAVVAARNDADKKLREAFQDDDKLRARLTKALDDVAALTLGREGLESGSPKPTGSAKPSGSPDLKTSFTPDAQAKVVAIVKAAVIDMDAITAEAEKAVAALPTANPGKPSGQPGAKPSDAGRPSEPGKADPGPATPSAKPTH